MNIKRILLLIAAMGCVEAQASLATLARRTPTRAASRVSHTATAATRIGSAAARTKTNHRIAMASKAAAAGQETAKATVKPVSIGKAIEKGMQKYGFGSTGASSMPARGLSTQSPRLTAKAVAPQPAANAANAVAVKKFMPPMRYGMDVESILSYTPSSPAPAQPKKNVKAKKVENKPVVAAQTAAAQAMPVVIDVQPVAVKTVKNKPKAVRTPSLAQLPRMLGRAAPQAVKPAIQAKSVAKSPRTVAAIPTMKIPQTVSAPKAVAASRAKTPMPVVVYPTPVADVADLTPRIQTLSHNVDVFEMPAPPKLMTAAQTALVPYAAVNAVRAGSASRAPAYTLHVPSSYGQQQRAHFTTASSAALVPYGTNTALAELPRYTGYSDRGYSRGYRHADDDSGYSWLEKTLMAGAATGAAGLMLSYANGDSKELVESNGAMVVDQARMQELFPYFGDAMIVLAQQAQDQMDGILAGPVQQANYKQALAVLKQVNALAQQQGLMPYLIEESQMPAQMLMNDPDGIQVLRLEGDKSQLPALQDGQDNNDGMQLALSKDNKNQVAAIISGRTVRMAVGLDQDGQQVYKRFYLAFVNPQLLNPQDVQQSELAQRPLVGFLMSPATRRMLALNQPKEKAALPAPQPVEAQESEEMGMMRQPSYSGGRNVTLDALMRQRAVDQRAHGHLDSMDNHLSRELALPAQASRSESIPMQMSAQPQAKKQKFDDRYWRWKGAQGIDRSQDPAQAVSHESSVQARLHPIKWAVREYGNDFITALQRDLPLENQWARGSAELIDTIDAYNAMREYWQKNVNDSKIERVFAKCKQNVHRFINGIQATL